MWLKKIPLNRELFSILTILSLFGSGESKPFIIRYCENWNLLSQLEGQNPHGWNIAFKVQTKFTFNDFVFWKINFSSLLLQKLIQSTSSEIPFFSKLLKFHLPALCIHSLEHLKDFCSWIRIFLILIQLQKSFKCPKRASLGLMGLSTFTKIKTVFF